MSENNRHNGNGADKDEKDEKIIEFRTLADRDRQRRKHEHEERKAASRSGREPFIKLPLWTKLMLFVFIAIHLVVSFGLSPPQQYWLYANLGFTPAHYTSASDFPIWAAILGPFSYMFLHGNWVHVILNSVMLMAFGTGIERWMGGRRMFLFFYLCAVFSALFHFMINPFSTAPVIGASGGLSGLFAGVIVMLHQRGLLGQGRHGIMPFVILWVAISIIFGFMGGPGSSQVAWAAHIGGFLAGFLFLKPLARSGGPI